jgi:lipopolysaccharide export system protein LptA
MTLYKVIIPCLLAAALFFINCPVFSQQAKVIELRSADTLKGKIINGEEVRELIGNVHFVQIARDGLVHVWCDRAIRFMIQNRIELFGSVKIVRDSVTIRSNEGIYDGNSRSMEGRNGVKLERGRTVLTASNGKYFVDDKLSHFTGNVVLVDTSSVITSDEMYYYETETRSIAIGNVHVYEKENAINIYGDSLIHIEQKKITLALKQPRLVRIDTTDDNTIDTLVVKSRMMKSIQDSVERFIGIDSVQIVRGTLAARCGIATYYVKDDFIDLGTDPVIWSAENQVTGDSIRVTMEEKNLRTLHVKHHAMVVSRVDSLFPGRFNQLTGRELTMFFRTNKLVKVDVLRNATSLYYLFDNMEPNGLNKSSGDYIYIDFLNNEVDRIKVVGGVIGQYFPEKMIFGREYDYNLDGFKLYRNRPKRQGLFITSK